MASTSISTTTAASALANSSEPVGPAISKDTRDNSGKEAEYYEQQDGASRQNANHRDQFPPYRALTLRTPGLA